MSAVAAVALLARSARLSSVLGYISIGSWLGAQFPCVSLSRAIITGLTHSLIAFLDLDATFPRCRWNE